ncbi:MAG: VOC family protein [Solirubrobacterales bacterium]|nr:VOC family protein [Solirubrobacterales bacterium]
MSAISAGTGRAAPARIHPDTSLGTVRLTVTDLDRSRRFYEQALGLRALERDDGTLGFGVGGERPLVELRGDPSAPGLDRGATGLFHVAILMPSRRDLAVALARLAQAHWPLDGASDHLVSEALYLSDPDGNGIEIYRDRPREEWRQVNGQLQMSTLPLDVRGLLEDELADGRGVPPQAPEGTRIGHVHLQVADLEQSEAFYNRILGFDVTVRGYPGALFVSAGGYHHHLGLNTWHSRGAAPPASGAVGLRSFEVLLPDADSRDAVLERAREAGFGLEPQADGFLVRDPSGNGLILGSAPEPGTA